LLKGDAMALKNVWLKGALAISLYISCFVVTLFLVYGSLELFKGNEIPMRMYVLGGVAVINWLVIAYYSEEVFWRTLLKLVCYSLALFSLYVFLLGLLLVVKNFTDDSVQINLLNALLIAAVGGLCIYAFVRAGNSKWLNS